MNIRSLVSTIRRLISKLFGIKVKDGYSVNHDSNTRLDADIVEKHVKASTTITNEIKSYSPIYVLKHKGNYFELYGNVKNKDGGNSVRLRHIGSNVEFTITEELFKLMFERG